LKGLHALLDPFPVSLERTAPTEDKMLEQASELGALGKNAVIKVPMGGYPAVVDGGDPFTGLKVVRRLWEKGIKTNVTLIFNTTQAVWAANRSEERRVGKECRDPRPLCPLRDRA